MQAKLIIALIVVIFVIIFVIWNQEHVSISFVFWSTGPLSVSIVIFFSMLIGALATYCVGLRSKFKLKRELKVKSEQIGKLKHHIVAAKNRHEEEPTDS